MGHDNERVIGVFDSGVGGLCAYYELRRLLPRQDIIYLADRGNAPYGTKSKDELISLTKKDIKRLSDMGAERILIACCTASSVYPFLTRGEKEICLPIITPAAILASKYQKVLVIATEGTVKLASFSRTIGNFSDTEVLESPRQELVSLVETGNRDGHIDEKCAHCLNEIRILAESFGAQALILGCTHFSHLENEFKRLLPNLQIISPAREGAIALAKQIKKKNENGRTVYT